MKIAVLSYSHTGNNEALAESVANNLKVEHIRIKERKTRKNGTIIMDVLLHRKPKVVPSPEQIQDYDYIIMMGPVWMGKIASPFRNYLEHLKSSDCKYAYFSVSGGALGPNDKLGDELVKRVGRVPEVQLDSNIADFIDLDHQATTKDTSNYKITQYDIEQLTEKIVTEVKKTLM